MTKNVLLLFAVAIVWNETFFSEFFVAFLFSVLTIVRLRRLCKSHSKLHSAKNRELGYIFQKPVCIATYYSKSQIFVQIFNFDKTLQYFSGNQSCQQLKSPKPQDFHEFSPQIFLTIFLVKPKLSTVKTSKTAAFSRVFTQNIRQFFRHIKIEFLDKKRRFRTVCAI